jgi:hypothetical protein
MIVVCLAWLFLLRDMTVMHCEIKLSIIYITCAGFPWVVLAPLRSEQLAHAKVNLAVVRPFASRIESVLKPGNTSVPVMTIYTRMIIPVPWLEVTSMTREAVRHIWQCQYFQTPYPHPLNSCKHIRSHSPVSPSPSCPDHSLDLSWGYQAGCQLYPRSPIS